MGNFCHFKTHKKSKSLPTHKQSHSFIQYYNQMMHDIFENNFDFNSNKDNEFKFHEKLAMTNGITGDESQSWLRMYIDYMITNSFLIKLNIHKESQYSLFAPFEIMQTWRLHTIHFVNYQQFCHILLGKPELIHLHLEKFCIIDFRDPNDSVVNQYTGLVKEKTILEELLYNVLVKADNEIKFAEASLCFHEAFLTNELEFCFMAEKTLKEHREILRTLRELKRYDLNSPQGMQNVISEYRQNLGLDGFNSIATNHMHVSSILDDLIPENQMNNEFAAIVNSIDFMILPHNFIEMFTIEQQLNSFDAINIIKEYKKFLFLMKVSGFDSMMLKPCFLVAQAWFLHMNNTKNYIENMNNLAMSQQYIPESNL